MVAGHQLIINFTEYIALTVTFWDYKGLYFSTAVSGLALSIV